MGGSSTPQNANAGNALTNLFLSNQAAPHVATPTIAAPQAMLGQGGQMPSMPSSQSPVSYTPPAPAPGYQGRYAPSFTADPQNPGFGYMSQPPTGWEHGVPIMGASVYVPAPAPKPAAPAYQPSAAAQMATAVNQKYARK